MSGNPAQATANQTPPATPPPVVVGGPGANPDGTPATITTPARAAPAAPAAAPATPARGPVIIGNKSFADEASAIAYANELERRAAVQPAPVATAPIAPATNAPINPASILFEDPETALRMVKDQAVSEFQERENKAKANQESWAKFYKDNPDLVGFEDQVELARARGGAEMAKMHIDQGFPVLAAKTRETINRIRQTANKGVELGSGPAVVAGSSGPTPPAPVTPAAAPKSFIEEMQDMQRGRKAKKS